MRPATNCRSKPPVERLRGSQITPALAMDTSTDPAGQDQRRSVW
jgi:hypothetical protein